MTHIVELLARTQRESSSEEAVCGIIYTLKRDTADEVAAALRSKGAHLCELTCDGWRRVRPGARSW